jgi:hypothetical protein
MSLKKTARTPFSFDWISTTTVLNMISMLGSAMTLLQNPARPKSIPTMGQGDVVGNPGKAKSVLQGGISAAGSPAEAVPVDLKQCLAATQRCLATYEL